MGAEIGSVRYYLHGENHPLSSLASPVLCMFKILDRNFQRYDCRFDGEQAVFHCLNERAMISQFAGGIWQSHQENMVVEEHCAAKKATKRGRKDISFAVVPDGLNPATTQARPYPDEQRFYGEAKSVALLMPRKGITTQRIEKGVVNMMRKETDTAWNNVEHDLGPGRYYHHAVGILFVHLHVESQHESTMAHHIQDFLSKMQSCLQQFTTQEPYVVLEGRYYPSELRKPDRFYEWWPGKPKALFPGLTLLICERRQG
jgi:hypothetical protein